MQSWHWDHCLCKSGGENDWGHSARQFHRTKKHPKPGYGYRCLKEGKEEFDQGWLEHSTQSTSGCEKSRVCIFDVWLNLVTNIHVNKPTVAIWHANSHQKKKEQELPHCQGTSLFKVQAAHHTNGSSQIHLVCSTLIMLQGAKLYHSCYLVDYKRGVLEIMPNSKEGLIMVSAFIHLSSVACGLTWIQRCLLEKQGTHSACAQKLQRPVYEALFCELGSVFRKF